MIIRKVSRTDLERALEKTNEKYDNNVIWNNFQQMHATTYRVTLKVKDSHGKGSRLGQHLTSRGNHRHLISACWHVHGDFFDNLFEINPNAIVEAMDKTITIQGGNWQDSNIGSYMFPLYYSEACECEGYYD